MQKREFGLGDRMRYRFLMSLFGMSLDKRKFAEDFGVSIDLGLALEMAFMRSVGAFAVDNAERLELSEKGRYLLVVMMRQFFIGVNNLRDQARAALSGDERRLLFGDAHCASGIAENPVALAVEATEQGQDSPSPH